MRFRLRTLFLLMTLVAIALAGPAIYRKIQFHRFVSCANVDLRSLDYEDSKLVTRLFSRLTASIPEVAIPSQSRVPWYIWPVDNGKFMYLRGSPCYIIPGVSSVYIHLFDSNGNVISATTFSTGYRITIRDASISKSPSGHFIIEIESEPVVNGRDVAKQYYALMGNDVVLLRLEDSKGLATENLPYNWIIGGEPPASIQKNWLDMLQSGDRIKMLAALNFLESHRQPDTLQQLKKLAQHSDRWIAEAARLARDSVPWEERDITLEGAKRNAE